MSFFAGDVLTAAQLNALPLGIVARHARGLAGSASAVGATETGFIRVDGVSIRNGYSYEVTVPRTIMSFSATSAASAVIRLRGSTSGNATTASAQLDGGEVRVDAYTNSTSFSPEVPLIGFFHSTTTGTLSVLVTFARTDGTSTLTYFASTGALIPVIVKEIGLTPTDSGTDL